MIVVDTNILFSFFWKGSITKKLIETCPMKLFSPIKALEEIDKYSGEIKKRLNLSIEEFNLELIRLKSLVTFIDAKAHIKEAESISPDKGDSEFLALCLQYKAKLWSNDSDLKKQDRVQVFSTKELIEIFF